MTYQQQISIRTTGHGHMHNLTEQVATIVAKSEIRTGTVNVFNVGSTAAVGAIEFEPGLQQDLPQIWTNLSRRAGITGMSRHGTTAMDIPISRRLC